LVDATSRLAPVTLERVFATAALQTRLDRKYVVPLDALMTALGPLDGVLSVLQIGQRRLFSYESVYFDTPDLAAYFQHARGRRRRVKVRTRAYLDSGECLLEFKSVGSRGDTVKERYPHQLASRHALDDQARALASQRVGHLIPVAALQPALTTSYHRVTLVDTVRGQRITCDVNLRFLTPAGQSYRAVEDLVIVESKSARADSLLDLGLRRLGSRPQSLSKYCVGMAILEPELPANHWNRELRTHFGWSPRRARLVEQP
jgi:hypothetical protein